MADGGYTGNNFAQSVQAMINAEVIIAKQSDLRHGQVTPQRWVIERSFSWLGKYRRLWRNCERKLNTSKMMISLPANTLEKILNTFLANKDCFNV
ncbi:Transposase DDE domain protein [Lactiplantibacillus plantarum]|nr:Transposase DDE domain protein [Lactiplantibacillus plantarum]SPH10966.1 Transposase DDE domain protein [Lactiplantibacillus plantarum]